MPRDYAKQSRQQRKPIPGWIWMAGGLFIGLFVALLVYLDKQPDIKAPRLAEVVGDLKAKSREATAELAEKAREQTSSQKQDGQKDGPRFDFYHILPELEVAIPDTDLVKEEKREASAVNKSTTTYLLQAGSFRELKEADRLKASLALLGLQARIESVTINNKDTWHRVRIGPYTSIRELGKAKNRLQANGIQSMVLKLKG